MHPSRRLQRVRLGLEGVWSCGYRAGAHLDCDCREEGPTQPALSALPLCSPFILNVSQMCSFPSKYVGLFLTVGDWPASHLSDGLMSTPPPPQAGLSVTAELLLSKLSPAASLPFLTPPRIQAQCVGLRGPTAGLEGRRRTWAQAVRLGVSLALGLPAH